MTTKLTDSGTQRAIDDAAERGAALALERSKTPVVSPRASDSSEMFDVAERVVDRKEPAHMLRCRREGPAHEVCEIIDGIKQDFEIIQKDLSNMRESIAGERGEARGVLRAQARQATLLMVAVALAGVAANILIAIARH